MCSEAFSRSQRLTTANDYRQVFKTARKCSDGIFTVLWIKSSSERPRLGLAISKKHLKKAVDRNLAKRIARESFRHNQTTLPAVDIVILVGRRFKSVKNAKMFNSLTKHWQCIIDNHTADHTNNG